VHVLAAQTLFASGLFQRAIGPLSRLHELGHIVALGVRWRGEVCYLYHAEPGMSAGDAIGRTHLTPATASGIGMALLATLSDDQVAGLYGKAPPHRYDSTDALIADLRRVRAAGHAVVEYRSRPLVRSVGVAVGDPAYAAIALSGNIHQRAIPKLAAHLREAAEMIEPTNPTQHGA